jgi:hypothetical protein
MQGERDFNKAVGRYGAFELGQGKLTGTNDGDYFYMFCPKCLRGKTNIMRFGNAYLISEEQNFPYSGQRPKPRHAFIVGFELHCPHCGFSTTIKLSNSQRQGGRRADLLSEH